MIDIQTMSFRYSQKKTVFVDLSLQLPQGGIYGLLGKNGTGKSTLLYLIAGLLRPDSGTVSCDIVAAPAASCPVSCNIVAAPTAPPESQPSTARRSFRSCDRRPQLLEQMYVVPEEFEFPLATLDRYVADNAPFYPRFSHEVLERCLREFDLSGTTKLYALSMGQKKKVLISFALATQAQYLLMDEPTNGLDIPSKSQFRKVIAQNMTDERTIIISTHQVHDVEPLLDHILILSDYSTLLLNESVASLTSRLAFTTCQVNAEAAGALYSEPSPQGLAVIAPRTPDMPETELNLELLFNAVTKGAIR